MNQKCSVCNEPAAGFHFGAFTCEGCKSFFGRTYNNADIVSRCRNGGNCEINKKSRTSCKACRMRKCLEVGMSKSSSRYGRRSNMFKMNYRLLVETEDTQNERPHIAPSYNLLPPKPQSWGDDEIDAASTSQTNSAKYANDATNSHNNEFPLHNWNNQEPQLPTTPPPSTSNQVTSSLTDNQIQRQNPMQYPPPLTRYYRPPLMESRPRSTSNNSEEEHLDVESRSSSSRVSPFTPNRVNESSALSIVAVDLMFMSAQSTINSLIHSIPNIITPEAFMMRSGGLADEPNEPIDLSMRASDSSSQSSESSEKKSDKENQINDSDSSSTEESAANPLDLTFNTTPLKLNFKF